MRFTDLCPLQDDCPPPPLETKKKKKEKKASNSDVIGERVDTMTQQNTTKYEQYAYNYIIGNTYHISIYIHISGHQEQSIYQWCIYT